VKRLLCLFLLFLVCACRLAGAAEGPASPELRNLIERVDAKAAAEWSKDRVGGLTVGIVTANGLAWTKSYGWADAEKKVPAASETVYRIGSITKQFTALLLLQLARDGKVHLSDPVEKYFPEVNKIQGRFPGAPPITRIQLATHTSGLGAEPEDTETYLKGSVADWEKVLIAALPHTRYVDEPGTRFNYSNIGYAILGAALARAGHQPYVEMVQQRIFQPLGMSSSFLAPGDRERTRIAKGYLIEDDGKLDTATPEREHQGRGYKVPNGAIYTTVGDLARFLAFEMGDELFAESFERLVTTDPDLRRGYGTGFQVVRFGETVLVGHTGGVAGYQAALYFDRGSRTGVILLRNAVGGSFEGMAVVRAALAGGQPDAKR
jgi:CubicO group peptidase (beta-lactamase class C family)